MTSPSRRKHQITPPSTKEAKRPDGIRRKQLAQLAAALLTTAAGLTPNLLTASDGAIPRQAARPVTTSSVLKTSPAPAAKAEGVVTADHVVSEAATGEKLVWRPVRQVNHEQATQPRKLDQTHSVLAQRMAQGQRPFPQPGQQSPPTVDPFEDNAPAESDPFSRPAPGDNPFSRQNPANDPFGEQQPRSTFGTQPPSATTPSRPGTVPSFQQPSPADRAPAQLGTPNPMLEDPRTMRPRPGEMSDPATSPQADPTDVIGDILQDVPPPKATDCENNQECRVALDYLKDSTLADISLDIRIDGTAGDDFPCECPLGVGETLEPRTWASTIYTWKASALCHKPLYFEEVHLERYGHSWGPYLDPAVSAAHFFIAVPLLPYKMGLEPPCECIYTLGYYRPGSCAPYLLDPIPISPRGALFQAGVVTGLAAGLP